MRIASPDARELPRQAGKVTRNAHVGLSILKKGVTGRRWVWPLPQKKKAAYWGFAPIAALRRRMAYGP